MKKQLLTLTCIVALATSSFAQFSGGTGTKPDPYLIANKTDVLTLSTNSGYWSNHFKQTANINFTSADFATGGAFYNNGEGFSPIGNDLTNFTGSYNGQGFSVDSLKITRPAQNFIGFFGWVNTTDTLKSIAITNCSIQGKDFTGGLVGNNSNGAISNSYSTGSVSGGIYFIGGLVGFYETGTIYNSYSTASVSGTAYIGGLVGNNSNGAISNSYATGSVTGSDYIGGLIGYYHNGTISNSYSTGAVSGSTAIGGLVGGVSSGTISNSYSIGLVYGTSYAGGLVGYNSGGSVTNSFWDINTSGQSLSYGGTGKTTAEMKTLATFTTAGWDFEGESTNGTTDIWKMGNCVTNKGYPIFSWQILNAEPTSSVTSQTDVSCNGGNNGAATVSISGGTPNYTYSWLPSGGTAATASSLAAGVYTCTITDANTCIKTQSVTITEPMAIVGSQTLTLCAGQSTTVGSNIYNTSGVFTDVLTAVNGCDSTVTTNLTIENPIDITTSANAETITANATGATYQWIDCNNSNLPIAGETNQSFTATANGNYAVVITQGLCSDTSACVPITTVGLKSEINNHTSAIKIMPNPSAGLFNIELQQNSTITITDALGRTVLTQQLNSGKHQLDLVNQSNGVYFININNTNNYKIIKQN